ncbi:multi antimicrobial extrusion protein MatE [Azospirillum sp. B510]|uniref:multi antimicrobial extrusion protein MatE n=1 Tax=Azospirillum sp. (strain B510) TaxID=137722 RepID=UPI0011D11D66|nr:multi antimicrobial extrusion protein MatE [Azospirillum sp. B510]
MTRTTALRTALGRMSLCRAVVAEAAFWRGYLALLFTFLLAQTAPQIDLALLARSPDGAVAAYVVVVRLALLETVATMALGSVASVAASRAAASGSASGAASRAAASEVSGALWLAALAGGLFALAGALAYPFALPWVAGGDAGVGAMAAAALPWFIATTPIRMVGGTAAFLLHAVGRGGLAIRWKSMELAARAGVGFLIVDRMVPGAAGCFVAALLVTAPSAVWAVAALRVHASDGGRPDRAWLSVRLRAAAWESQRLLSFHLLGLATLALFAAPLGGGGRERLEAYAAASVLVLALFAPLVAQLRFLAMRLAGCSAADVAVMVRARLAWGMAVGSAAGLTLAVAGDGLGRWVYHQEGRWWSALVCALALSVPWRVVGNMLRAALQATGGFAGVARADGLFGWLFGLPLTALGLWWDCPALAAGALLLPEVAAVVWLWSRLARAARTGAGDSTTMQAQSTVSVAGR